MMLVVPPAAAADVPVKKSSEATVPMKEAHVGVMMPPGMTKHPPASMTLSSSRCFQILSDLDNDFARANDIRFHGLLGSYYDAAFALSQASSRLMDFHIRGENAPIWPGLDS